MILVFVDKIGNNYFIKLRTLKFYSVVSSDNYSPILWSIIHFLLFDFRTRSNLLLSSPSLSFVECLWFSISWTGYITRVTWFNPCFVRKWRFREGKLAAQHEIARMCQGLRFGPGPFWLYRKMSYHPIMPQYKDRELRSDKEKMKVGGKKQYPGLHCRFT